MIKVLFIILKGKDPPVGPVLMPTSWQAFYNHLKFKSMYKFNFYFLVLLILAGCSKQDAEIKTESPDGVVLSKNVTALTKTVKILMANDFSNVEELKIKNIEYYKGGATTYAKVFYMIDGKQYDNIMFTYKTDNPDLLQAGYHFVCRSNDCLCSVTITTNQQGQVTSADCGGGCQSCHFEQTPN